MSESNTPLIEHRLFRDFAGWKQHAKGGPALLSVSAVVGGTLQVLAGLVTALTQLLTLRPLIALLNIYMIVFGLFIIAIEVARWTTFLGIRHWLQQWFRFTQRCIGRGVLHLFVATFALIQFPNPLSTVTGAILGLVGIATIITGIYAGFKVQELHQELKAKCGAIDRAGGEGPLGYAEVKWQFALMDQDGSGQVTRNELDGWLKKNNIAVSELELEALMAYLDPDGSGSVNLDEFYAWFISRHGWGPAWV
ncbi:unnamed protein product [Vitrella brassicaformis CCMP3155]|uniref:EF-hand domain-containing protein n=2 Tax=Vitrella brassicaformis TaxID=1169539 RepID=A0A0G4H7V3_VITBC|nr:unnamed protein product [Vitrella brassicaformis CCMP3155]|mmetsp:Transcript_22456/g.55359  ORF Transcript_22456/g.55359 Transcript_22456/m.55359 type:complete len:251 (+) Transcript_22456:97-849(+)|eukprot:CEM39956.1 unnamed protein product [Vitrella brassicaformis CCMP3155]